MYLKQSTKLINEPWGKVTVIRVVLLTNIISKRKKAKDSVVFCYLVDSSCFRSLKLDTMYNA